MKKKEEIMNVILEKDGVQRSYKAGNAMYLLFNLVPIIGNLTVFILMIVKKQFRGIFLNKLIIGICISIVATICVLLNVNNTLLMVISSLIGIYVLYTYVMNANYYSIKQRLAEGFVVVNDNDPEVKLAVEKANEVKTPFWQLTRF